MQTQPIYEHPAGVNASVTPRQRMKQEHTALYERLHRLREEIEAELDELRDCEDRLIRILDRLDGDPDLEGHSTEYVSKLGATRVLDPDCEPGADDEPSLGAPETWPASTAFGRGLKRDPGSSQVNWARGTDFDLEEEHDGREPDEHTGELEGGTDDNGIADPGGLLEQVDGREPDHDFEGTVDQNQRALALGLNLNDFPFPLHH